MMRLLYPLIASALITIAPFLLTFEKGQDIVRGLFGYSEFALLLLFACVKTRFNLFEGAPRDVLRSIRPRASREFFKVAAPVFLLVVLFALMVVVAWIDLLNLLAIKGWSTGWYGVLPFVTCTFAVAMLWKTRGVSLPAVSFILFVSLVAHLAAYNHYAAQPLAQFPVVDYLARTAPKPVERKKLPEDFAAQMQKALGCSAAEKAAEDAAENATAGKIEDIAQTVCRAPFGVTDSPSVARDFLDTTRSNVIVLVESWGIPMDPARFAAELDAFKGLPMQVGVHHRMYSRTRTAEREDLILSWRRDSTGHRDSTFLPSEFAKRGYATTFFFGGDSAEHRRYKYIRNIGFENVVWGALEAAAVAEPGTAANAEPGTAAVAEPGTAAVAEPKGVRGLNDSAMASRIDSSLARADGLKSSETTRPVFLAWTTRDTKFPLLGFADAYSPAADAVDSAYTVRLMGSLQLVADLARRYPNVRFVVQGDHDPILSPLAFQERFYKRWTPYVVLN